MNTEQHIKKGFNQGYALARLKPDLANKLATSFIDKSHPYAEGFQKGVQEFGKEKETQKGKSKGIDLLKYKTHNPTKSKNKNRDMEDRER